MDEFKATLDASRHHLPAEQVRNIHAVTVPAGLTREQIMHPDFWGGIAAKLRPYDRIEITSDDDTYFAQLLVLAAERTHAFMYVLEWHDLTQREPVSRSSEGNDYEIRHRGQHLKWCVIRKSDAVAIKETLTSQQAAQQWLAEYLQTVT